MKCWNGIKSVHFLLKVPHKTNCIYYQLHAQNEIMKITQVELFLTQSPR